MVCPPAGPGPTLFPLPDVCGDPCFPCQLHTYGCPEAPFWYFNVDAVGLVRDADDDRAFAVLGEFDGVDTTSVIDRLDTDDLGHWFELGGSFTLGYVCTPRYGVEVSFLGAKPWDQSAALRDSDGNLFSPFSDFGNPPLAAFDNNDVAWIREYSAPVLGRSQPAPASGDAAHSAANVAVLRRALRAHRRAFRLLHVRRRYGRH